MTAARFETPRIDADLKFELHGSAGTLATTINATPTGCSKRDLRSRGTCGSRDTTSFEPNA